jgi:S-formylglutathione hydrolase
MRSVVLAVALTFAVAAGAQRAPEGRLVFATVHSRALEKNLLGDSPDQSVIIYLPPSYDTTPTRRYPVVYLLHGNGRTNRTAWVDGYQGLNIKTAMDTMVASGASKEMIIVMPDAHNRYVGSHYVNSTVTGNWADFITGDVVQYLDATYRTLPSSASRGLAGHSMGGRGTLFLAATVPGVYGAIYSLSAGRMAFDTYAPFEDTLWRRVLALQDPAGAPSNILVPLGFAAAYSPNPSKPPFFVDLPVELREDQVKRVAAVFQRWVALDPITVVQEHPENLRKLRAVYLSCGTSDPLIGANRLMAQVLANAGIPYTLEEYEGDHEGQVRERIETKVLPMFSRVLAFQ